MYFPHSVHAIREFMPNVLPTRKGSDLNFTPGRDALLFTRMRFAYTRIALILNLTNIIIKSLLEQPTHFLSSC